MPNRLSSSKFSQAELELCCEMYTSGAYRCGSLASASSCGSSAPEAPTVAEQQLTGDFGASLPRPQKSVPPWWWRHICQNRDLFQDVAIGVGEPDSSGVLAALREAVPALGGVPCASAVTLELPASCVGGGVGDWDPPPPACRAEYEAFPFECVGEPDIPIGDDSAIWVRTGLRFEGGRDVTNMNAPSLEAFIVSHPKVSRAQRRPATRRQRAVFPDERAKLLAEHPWLQESDFPSSKGPRVGDRPRVQGRPRKAKVDAGTSGEEVILIEAGPPGSDKEA